jgi:quercetin dioxygenase-like cupin family protein
MTQQQQSPARALHTTTEGGDPRWWWGNLAVIKVTGEHTGGALAVVELTLRPNSMAPPHVHHREDETFRLLEGEVAFTIGDEEIAAGPGDLVVAPRDVPHRFIAGSNGARMLILIAPAGLEGLVREQSIPATALTLPPAGGPPPDLAKAREIALRYGCELLV